MAEQRIDTLKSILVRFNGTSRSLWNRFANVETFEEINRFSRKALIKTKDIVHAHGFELLYAGTDSVFRRKPARQLKIMTPLRIYSIETGIPISIEHNYKFLMLLPLKASESISIKQYFGITHSKELIARGTEIIRNATTNPAWFCSY